MSWEDYAEAAVDICLPDGWLRITPETGEKADGPFPAAAEETVHAITAHNPHGRLGHDEETALAHELLLLAVRSLAVTNCPAAGGDAGRHHVEVSMPTPAPPSPCVVCAAAAGTPRHVSNLVSAGLGQVSQATPSPSRSSLLL